MQYFYLAFASIFFYYVSAQSLVQEAKYDLKELRCLGKKIMIFTVNFIYTNLFFVLF